MNQINRPGRLGVIVGRFQVPLLHSGHIDLIKDVIGRSDRVLIVVGVTQSFPTTKDPLSFEARREAIRQEFPDVAIVPLADCRSDSEWSFALDVLVSHFGSDFNAITLYGSRDSFLKSYSGIFRTEEIAMPNVDSGTRVREVVSCNPMLSSPEWRAGVVYSVCSRPALVYPVVDVAITSGDKVLLGRKKQDPLGLWRFIGGFVGSSDSTLEDTVEREVREETGIMIRRNNIKYLGSATVRDWRYPDGTDVIMTAFFSAKMVDKNQRIAAADDIDSLCWYDIEMLNNVLVPEHLKLFNLFMGDSDGQ